MDNNLNIFKDLPNSYWISSTKKTDFKGLNKDINVDIAIVGGGMAGILCGYQLQNQGFKIAILEAGNIIESTTAHTTAKITSQHGLIYDKIKNTRGDEFARQYYEANEMAIGEIKRIADENNIDCDYSLQSSYIYTEKRKYKKQIEDEVKSLNSLGIDAKLIDKIELPIKIKSAMVFDKQAQFHPRKFLLGVAENIRSNGVKIYENTRATQLNEENGQYIINTSQDKKITASKVIIASHYPFYNKKGLYFSRIYVQRSYILAIKTKEKFPGGMYINAEDPSRSLRSHPTKDGELVLVVGEDHKTGQSKDTNMHYKALYDFAKEIFTVESVPYRWSTEDCMTLDGVPYVGQFAPDTPNLYINTGFGKWGMTNSVASSMVLRDLIVEGKSPWQDVYDPSRKIIADTIKTFTVENVNVGGQLLKGKLSRPSKNISIKRGEGKVVELKGEKVGAFRDDDGELYLVNTTCTHAGCELNWNSAERSWDCPCHSSRFTYKGDILKGPATKPLSFNRNVNILKKLFTEDF